MRHQFITTYSVILVTFVLSVYSGIPNQMGVNIHWNVPKPNEAELLVETGLRYIRTDVTWSEVERTPGVYDFSQVDKLVHGVLLPNNLKAIFIFDYLNNLYDNGSSPYTDVGRNAFASFALATVERYHSRGFIWEIYNEPNIDVFWKPHPNVTHYVALVNTTSTFIKRRYPSEYLIGPATSCIDFSFLESAFGLGLLNFIDAVSIHPYRNTVPESALADYEEVYSLINRYKPRGKHVPIIVSEWGYSKLYPHLSYQKQGKYVPRQFLVNMASRINLTILYDWHNDCEDEKNLECYFGIVKNTYYPDRYPCYELKPGYLAIQTMTKLLNGYEFDRLTQRNESTHGDYSIQFTSYSTPSPLNHNRLAFAAWSLSHEQHVTTIPYSGTDCFQLVDYLGNRTTTREYCSQQGGFLSVNVTSSPVYLISVQEE